VKKIWVFILAAVVLLPACGRLTAPAVFQPATAATAIQPSFTPVLPTAVPTETAVPPTGTPTVTPTITLTPTPPYPAEGRGPTGFSEDVNPLTGLKVVDPVILNRRPLIIKVENLPREHRPQWGLSQADIVYEYYTEFGATRFAAVYYGQDAERVGPIRSGRFFDVNLVQMYKAVFVYGSAYPDVQTRFFNSDFYSRLILENPNSCPALCRTDPNGQNLLVADTAAMQAYLVTRNVDNTRQNQDGMFFQMEAPAGGTPGTQVYVRYSGAIYNRWDYDQAGGRYLRFVDAANDVDRNNEVYAQHTDRLTNEPIGAENVVTLCVPHQYYVKREDAEVLDIIMDQQRIASYVGCDGQTYTGDSGAAYAARDGQMYKVIWKRTAKDAVLSIQYPDGSPFPLKPGQTWFEVIGASSEVTQPSTGIWRFIHHMGL
jgi:hypothetical protein